MSTTSRWLQRWGKRVGLRARVYGVPHAGAGAADLRALAAAAPEWLEVVAVRLPGRERRIDEPLATDLRAVVAGIADAVAADSADGVPFLLFGQCAGSLLAFEVARLLASRGAVGPVGMALSAPPNPDQDCTGAAAVAARPDFAELMVSMGALPAGVLAEPAMLEVVLPVLRADYTLFEGYRCGDGTTVEVPLLTVAGTRDTLAPPESMAKWAPRTTRGFSTRVLEGGHLLAAEIPSVLAAEVTAFAAGLVPGGVLRAS